MFQCKVCKFTWLGALWCHSFNTKCKSMPQNTCRVVPAILEFPVMHSQNVNFSGGTFPCAWVLKTPDPHSNVNCTSPVHLLYADAPHRFHAFFHVFPTKEIPKKGLSTESLHGIPSASEARFGGLRSERLKKCELQFSWKLRQQEKK